MLFEESGIRPDIYIVGLQEMVPLNTKEVVVGKDKQRSLMWQEVILNNLGPDYIHILHKTMVGCEIQMFARREHKNRIKNLKKFKVKTGLSGMTGNKGAVSLRFTFDDTSFAFINTHLEAGQDKVGERLEQARQIYNETFNDFSVSLTQAKCFHDYKFFFGDMNFRIDLPNDEVRRLVNLHDIEPLLAQDQLLKCKDKNMIFMRYFEAPIQFLPTYRYDMNCDLYDSSKKNRIPAYTDRVLMSRDQQFKSQLLHDVHKGNDEAAAMPIYYNKRNSYLSDHRPVLAVYKLPILKINHQNKQKLRKQILQTLLGNGRISREVVREKSKQMVSQDFNQIIQDNYLEPERHKDLI